MAIRYTVWSTMVGRTFLNPSIASQQWLLGAHHGAKHRMEVQDEAVGSEKQPWSATAQDKGNDGEIREERQPGEPASAMESA